MKLEPLGDSAVVATLGSRIDAATLSSVLRCAEAIASAHGKGIVDVVPAYATVTVFYDPAHIPDSQAGAYESVCRFIEACAGRAKGSATMSGRSVEIPVCYAQAYGPDLEFVAKRTGVLPAEIGALHAGGDYLVHAIGFTPGFPYLGGLPARLHTPRRESPRARVPAGSVGIGGAQTGVYPMASPGGWQIIGRTPISLFRPGEQPAALLRPGDRVRFRPISAEEFESWK